MRTRAFIERLRHESAGVTVIELAVASLMTILVLGATLAMFDALHDSSRRTDEQNEAQDAARRYTDRLARELRNLASPTVLTDVALAQPDAIDHAGAHDLIFRVVDDVRPAASANAANVMRARYCLGADGRLLVQRQRWTGAVTPPVPAVATPSGERACPSPDAAWEEVGGGVRYAVAAEHVVNATIGRPLFSYDSTDPKRITRVRTDVFVDATPGRAPVATQLTSGVFLRNQNRAPRAAFMVTALPATPRGYRLNASASQDPESMPLYYRWTLVDAAGTRTLLRETDEVVLDHQFPAGQHRLELVVLDRARIPSAACVIDLPPTTTTQCAQP